MSFIWRRGLQHYRSCGARWGNRLNNMHPPSPHSHPMLTPLNYKSSHDHPKHDGGQPSVSSWPYSQPIHYCAFPSADFQQLQMLPLPHPQCPKSIPLRQIQSHPHHHLPTTRRIRPVPHGWARCYGTEYPRELNIQIQSEIPFYDAFVRNGEKIYVLTDFQKMIPLRTYLQKLPKLNIVEADEQARGLFRDIIKIFEVTNVENKHLQSLSVDDIGLHGPNLYFRHLRERGSFVEDVLTLSSVFRVILHLLQISPVGEFEVLLQTMESGIIKSSYDLSFHPTLSNICMRRHIVLMIRHKLARFRWDVRKFVWKLFHTNKWKAYVRNKNYLYACLFLSESREKYPDGQESFILFLGNLWTHWPDYVHDIENELCFRSIIPSDRLMEFFLRHHMPTLFLELHQLYAIVEPNHSLLHTV